MTPTTVTAARPTRHHRPLESPDRIPQDEEAFTKLFRQHYGPLMRYARHMTADASTASDVLQDVFLKLWETRSSLAIEASLKALLYTMVRNRALNLKRREAKFDRQVAVEQTESTVVESEEANRIDAHRLQRRLYDWIQELPPRRAEAFALSRYNNLSHEEIATIMGVSKRTVETHIVLALRELRGRLDALRKQDRYP